MKRKSHPLYGADARHDAKRIDELYGLDPVIEPGDAGPSGSELTDFVSITCPYCGESYGTPLDLSAGSSTYIEDCQVCCQPIELRVTVNDEGELMAVEPQRCE